MHALTVCVIVGPRLLHTVTSCTYQEWARAARQEEDMLMKLKAASLSGSPSAYRQTSLTDKHGRLKHGAEKAPLSAQADDALSKASKQSRASKGADSKPK